MLYAVMLYVVMLGRSEEMYPKFVCVRKKMGVLKKNTKDAAWEKGGCVGNIENISEAISDNLFCQLLHVFSPLQWLQMGRTHDCDKDYSCNSIKPNKPFSKNTSNSGYFWVPPRIEEVLYSTAYQARKEREREISLIKKFLHWKSVSSSGRVNKECTILCVQIFKNYTKKQMTFNSLNTTTVTICTTFFNINTAFFFHKAHLYISYDSQNKSDYFSGSW
jgi:hypothetical protein